MYYLERGGVTVSAVGLMGRLWELDNGDFDFGDKDGVGCGEGLRFDNEEDAAAAAAACICWLWCCNKLAMAAADEFEWCGNVEREEEIAGFAPNGGEDDIPDAKDDGKWGAPIFEPIWGTPGNDKAEGGGFWRAAAAAACL